MHLQTWSAPCQDAPPLESRNSPRQLQASHNVVYSTLGAGLNGPVMQTVPILVNGTLGAPGTCSGAKTAAPGRHASYMCCKLTNDFCLNAWPHKGIQYPSQRAALLQGNDAASLHGPKRVGSAGATQYVQPAGVQCNTPCPAAHSCTLSRPQQAPSSLHGFF